MQPDYQAEVHDHGTIRIALATPPGQENQRLNDRVQLKLEKHKELSISGRNLRMRYSWSKGYSGEWLAASAWGDVQLYRRPLGLIFIVDAKRQEDADRGIEEYIVRALRKELNASVYDGRCLLVGSKSSQPLKPDILHFQSVDAWKTSWKDIEDMVTSIYYILESKRVERSSMSSSNSDKSYPMLMAPFERREGNLDFDSRSFRKKLQGRLRKHIGDLCLLCGLPQEALIAYHSALDALRLSQDHLWVAASLESLCAVTASYSTVVKSDHCLESPNDIFEKYREAVINYSKFKEAGVLELEACLKATKVLVNMGRNLDASDFLQNTIYIGIKLPSEREIERLSTLADLYGMIGFKRKEAFYKRVAAMYCVADQNNSEARWQQCFSLLRESLPGFSLEHVLGFIKSSEYETDLFLSSGESTGWPAVQARVLHELAFSARKIGDTKLAIKLLSGLLHSTHSFLDKSEQEEMLQALKNYSSACREESEILYEPICLPSFVNVVIPTGNGDPNLEPIETTAQQTNRVFIYSPFEKDRKKIRWVKSEVNTIELIFYNPLAAEIDVNHISLVAKGEASPVNIKPQSVRLSPGSHVSVKIDCICEIVGEFEITGYRIDLYGLVYEVHFERLLKKRKEINILKSYKIEVIDTIPMLGVDVSLVQSPKALNIVRELQQNQQVKYKSAFYDGEHQKIAITIENVSQIPIGEIEVYQEVDSESKGVINFSCESAPSTLKPGERVIFEAFFDSELKDSKIETVLHFIKINYKEHSDVCYMRTHTTIFESDIIRPLEVIGLCVKQSESSEYATIVLECHNKAIEEINIIQSVPNQQGPASLKSTVVRNGHASVLYVQIEKLAHIPLSEQCMESALGLKWRCDPARYGVVHLSSTTLNTNELIALQASPLYWESEVDDEPLEEIVKNGKVMEPMIVRTTAINRTNEPFEDLKIMLEAVQEDSRGEFNVLDGAIMSTGLDEALTQVLESKSSVEFSHMMIPRYAGNFKIRFRAFVADKGSSLKSFVSPSYSFCISNPSTAL